MSTKTYTDEQGNVIVTLPVRKTEVTLRAPKGKDLKAVEVATKATGATNIGVAMFLASLLSVKPALTLEEVEEMDAEDVTALGEAIGNFRAFSKMVK